jgi:PleD family two-component response regulator
MAAQREALYKRGNERKEAHARIEELAQLYELTGLLNRRYIMKCLDEELVRVQRNGLHGSVAIIDLDFFKRINDQFGHPVGDEALRTFAITLFASIRTIDKLGRYGGEVSLDHARYLGRSSSTYARSVAVNNRGTGLGSNC